MKTTQKKLQQTKALSKTLVGSSNGTVSSVEVIKGMCRINSIYFCWKI